MNELSPIIKRPVEHIDLVKYAGASGDFNEIHTVSHTTREKGYSDVIAHGMFLMGWATQAIMEWFPHRRFHVFKVRFQAVTHPGTALTIKGNLETNDNGEVEIVDSKGDIKLIGYFELKRE
ncbi:MaoC/PaaZ C-terminal domain-containing protein [Metabacillus herbersteinensis]|uniref:MaoC/PaaZ C-terminal domain-containing protein n=1 Tax=Metabacillus herbersteinensis TaxID=283816 RepID=A0ABV6GFP8_9BACI